MQVFAVGADRLQSMPYSVAEIQDREQAALGLVLPYDLSFDLAAAGNDRGKQFGVDKSSRSEE